MQTFTVAQRRAIALGWASSGLDQATYSLQQCISPRTLRAWIARYASRQPPVEQVRAIVTDAIERLEAVLDTLDLPTGTPDSDGVDDVLHDGPAPTSIGMPNGSEDLPEIEDPYRPTATGMPSVGPACPPAPPPRPPARPTRPRPAPSQPAPEYSVKVSPKSFFYGA